MQDGVLLSFVVGLVGGPAVTLLLVGALWFLPDRYWR